MTSPSEADYNEPDAEGELPEDPGSEVLDDDEEWDQ
jgi:hypothetical protein